MMADKSEPTEITQQRLLNQNRRRGRWRIFWWSVAVFALLIGVSIGTAWFVMIKMPGESFPGELRELPNPLQSLRDELRRDVDYLSVEIGERNLDRYPALQRAANYVEQEFSSAGYRVERQTYRTHDLDCHNLEVALTGTTKADEIVLVVAHYDSVFGTPGANDNASGTAGLLALARRFRDFQPARTLRFVAVTNEEPPYFQGESMGSWVYARRCRQRNENLVAVLSLETIGYYRTEPGSQQYPFPFGIFYPSHGDFIAVVGNVGSRQLVYRVVDSFRRHAQMPSEGGAVPGEIDGVGWSDHWSFWQEGYAAVMITDTAPFRYPYYHAPEDTPDKLDFDGMARVIDGVAHVVEELVTDATAPPR